MPEETPKKTPEELRHEKLRLLCSEQARINQALKKLAGTRCEMALRAALVEIDADIKAVLGKKKPKVKTTPPDPTNVEPAPKAEKKEAPKPKAKAKKKATGK